MLSTVTTAMHEGPAVPARQVWAKEFGDLAARLKAQTTLREARKVLLAYLDARARAVARRDSGGLHALDFHTAWRCRSVLEGIFSPRSDRLAGFSAARAVWNSLRLGGRDHLREGFWQEMLQLFRGLDGRSGVYEGAQRPRFLDMTGPESGRERNIDLNRLGEMVQAATDRYKTGLDPGVVKRREENRARILKALGGKPSDWDSYKWHLGHIIRDADTLSQMVELSARERAAIEKAKANRMPFAITPYYVSLFDRRPHREEDHAVRAQVIPPMDYVEGVVAAKAAGIENLDFMRELDTSPINLVTRRYPQIAIFKPFNTCAQICVYCQRNWEIEDAMMPGALATKGELRRAIEWFRRQTALEEVLITGGDPLMMPDAVLSWILSEFAKMRHIKRLRIGSRAPVVLPMRFTRSLLDILKRFHTDRQRLCLVTHFEHPYEVTPDAREAVARVRALGMNVYNQQVFTIENSRRFETCALRKALKQVSVDPYYTFCTKGKKETAYYMVPIARILQERQEEARLTPGIVRTDEPVFNLPQLGKSHLRAGQNHQILSIMPDGSRVYEFLPWEKNLAPCDTYVYRDVPIYDYLRRLAARGEDPSEYDTIWYYF